MLPVVGDNWLDLGQFPYLMTKRFGLWPDSLDPNRQQTDGRRETTSVHSSVGILVRALHDQVGPRATFRSALSLEPFCHADARCWEAVTSCGVSFQRRHLGFQRGNPLLIAIDHCFQQRPKFGRQGGNQFRLDRQLRHGPDVAERADRAKADLLSQLRQGVNGSLFNQHCQT